MILRAAVSIAQGASLFVLVSTSSLLAQPRAAVTVAGWRTPTGDANRYADAGGRSREQSPPLGRSNGANSPGGVASETTRNSGVNRPPVAPLQKVPGAGPIRARVTKGSGTLPNDRGQVWREYDITPYSSRVTTTNRPEQAIVDWILRETGYEAWHGSPLGILSADRTTLRVYHTPEMQTIVADVVDRFVNSQAKSHAFGLRIVTIRSPNWRARALRLMKPIPIQSSGVQGWLIAKEDAALLISELRRRTDFREHNSPHLLVHNGQSTVISTMRQRTYTKGITMTGAAWPGYVPEMGILDEGFSLEFSPLVSLDNQTVDAVIKLRLNQIEKMVPVQLDVPTPNVKNQQTQIEVPQLTMCDLHERFRWPVGQVLLLSMGVVATPEPEKGNVFTDILPMLKTPPRADALLFVESKGRVESVEAAAATARRNGPIYHGRY